MKTIPLPKCCVCECDALACIQFKAHSRKEYYKNRRAIFNWQKATMGYIKYRNLIYGWDN